MTLVQTQPRATLTESRILNPVSRRRHMLDLDDFSAQEIEAVLQTTAAMKDVLQRPIKKVPTLRGKTLVTLFYEASTRTRVGFELAAKALGADTVSVAANTSSVTKGESLIDTTRTLQALGADFVVIRHHQAGAPYVIAEEVSASVINAGDGWHAHPTQALLDLFTIRERLGRISQPLLVLRPRDECWDATARVREAQPAARVLDLPDQGADLFQSAPGAVADSVRAFLRG